MMLLYGCKAPWLMPNSNKTCETDLAIKTMKSDDMDKISDFFYKLQLHDMFDILPVCPKPCVTMDVKVKTLLTGTGQSLIWVSKSKQVCYLNKIRNIVKILHDNKCKSIDL